MFEIVMKKTSSARQSLRIIMAITGKDILYALKNKTTLATMILALFLIVIYKFLPTLSMSEVPFIFLYDADHSVYSTELEKSLSLHVHRYDSFTEFEQEFRTHITDASLGLVLPVGFDQALTGGEVPTIQGYAMHWISQRQVDQQRIDVENRIASILGSPIRIDMQGGTMTMLPQSAGGFLASAATVIALIFVGITLIPHLILEEKTTRTMDALQVSPANSSQIVIAKALAGLFYCLSLVMVIIFMNSTRILQWNLALIAALLTALMSVMLGLVLGTLMDNPQQVRQMSSVLMIPLFLPVFLSFMVGLVPSWLIEIMSWFPTVAASDLMRLSFTSQVFLSQSMSRVGLLLASIIILMLYETWLLRRVES